MKPRLRKKRKKLLLVLLILLSLAALFAEVSGTIEKAPMGRVVLTLFYPVIKAAGLTGSMAERAGDAFFHTERLSGENESLRRRIAELQLEKVELLEQNKILETSQSIPLGKHPSLFPNTRIVPSHIVSRSPNPWSRTVLVNRGTKDGVRREQTVMTEGGVAGVVGETTANLARVHLLVDPRSSLTVRILETGELGIVEGTGGWGELRLRTEGLQRRLRRNDHIVTAGLDNSLFPRDLPIGKVDRIERDKYGRTSSMVTPSVDFRRVELLFILAGSERPGEQELEVTP